LLLIPLDTLDSYGREVYKRIIILFLKKEEAQNCQIMIFVGSKNQLRSYAKTLFFIDSKALL